MSHWPHIYAKAYDTKNPTMCEYPKSDHALPHWKCVLQCCAKCLCVNIPHQEIDDHYSYTNP